MCGTEVDRNLSKTGSGTRGMIIRKYSSLIFLITSLWFICMTVKFIKSDFTVMSQIVASPWNFGFLMIFIISGFTTFLHDFSEMMQDYVHSHKKRFIIMFLIYSIAAFAILALLVSVIHFHIFMQIANNL